MFYLRAFIASSCIYFSLASRSSSGSTFPLMGSVPRGRRKSNICCSGLSKLQNVYKISNINNVSNMQIYRTYERHNAPIRGFAAHPQLSTRPHLADVPWEYSSRHPLVKWHAYLNVTNKINKLSLDLGTFDMNKDSLHTYIHSFRPHIFLSIQATNTKY